MSTAGPVFRRHHSGAPAILLEYLPPKRKNPLVNTDYSILFEDRDCWSSTSPGNLPCHPGGRYFQNTLWGLLKTERSGDPLFFVNRIDRETSGVVLLTKTPSAAKHCQRQFQSGMVRKIYLVGVEGDFPSEPVCAEGLLSGMRPAPSERNSVFPPWIPGGRSPAKAGDASPDSI